jgi:hypothetical protein
MSPLAIFLALSTLGCDFLLIFLFQWVYGEKRRLRQIRSLRNKVAEGNSAKIRLMLPASDAAPRRPSASLRVVPSPSFSTTREQLAHRRIAASLVSTRPGSSIFTS